jgi:hypothetical protein
MYDDFVAGRDEIRRHVLAHRAQADETDLHFGPPGATA